MRAHREQRGFVLLMVLVILTMAGVLLATSARRSAEASLNTHARIRELQAKWAQRSISDFFMQSPEAVLTAAGGYKSPAPSSLETRLDLCDHEYRIILCDEQTKVNVNALVAGRNRIEAESDIRELTAASRGALPVNLQPGMTIPNLLTAYPQRYTTYEQVFRYDHVGEFMPATGLIDSPTRYVTCWGSGRINLRKCNTPVLNIASRRVLTHSERTTIKDYVDEYPDSTLEEILAAAIEDPKKRKQAARLLTGRSNCHSLWIIRKGMTRNWYNLIVQQQADAECDEQQWTFEW